MISLMLQCCPADQDAAMELTWLICDLEKERRPDTEFFLTYRKDCPAYIPKCFESMARPKFARAAARQARNHDVGWPGGSNMLAQSAQMEMSVLEREGIAQNEAYLLFEPDCVPLVRDWIDQLSAEWDRVKATGKEAFGHWSAPGGIAENLHMNGNAVFRVDFHARHPTIMVGPATQGWDFWFRERIIPLSCDSNLIHQLYNCHGISYEDYVGLTKNAVRPAFLHGIKTSDGRVHARRYLLGEGKLTAPPA